MLLRFVQPASAKNVYFFPWSESSYSQEMVQATIHKFLVSFLHSVYPRKGQREVNFLTEFYETVIWFFSLYFIHKICTFTSDIVCSNFPFNKYKTYLLNGKLLQSSHNF